MRSGVAVDSDVLIVGGGAAGLYAAYRLQQADISFKLLEADDHVGGRVHSRPENHSHLGLVLDDGANLINSTDTLAIRLMNNFGITYVRRLKSGVDSMNYLHDGQLYTQSGMDRLLFQESRTALNHMLHDQDAWRSDIERDFNPKFIDESIASYLARCDAGPVLKAMLKSFFWSEYGHLIENLNLHVLFDYLEIDLAAPNFRLIPNVDEAYTVPDGTGQIASALERATRQNILYGRRVNRIEEQNGFVSVTATNTSQNQETHTARQIFFAAPLHSLRKISVSVDGLSQHAIDQAQTSSYASGTKLHLKFTPGFDRVYAYTGILLTDTGEQIWSSGTGQGGGGPVDRFDRPHARRARRRCGPSGARAAVA